MPGDFERTISTSCLDR